MDIENDGQVVTLPLWRTCLEEMKGSLAFDSVWPAEFFEERFRCKRTDHAFEWEMIALRRHLEEEDGYYLRSENDGASHRIPSAAQHEDVSTGFDRKVKRYAKRSVTLRASVLMNPAAQLNDAERRLMESNMERAAHRLLLLSRSQTIADRTDPKRIAQ